MKNTKRLVAALIAVVLVIAGIVCVVLGQKGQGIYNDATTMLGCKKPDTINYILDTTTIEKIETDLTADAYTKFLTGTLGLSKEEVEPVVAEHAAYAQAAAEASKTEAFVTYVMETQGVTEDEAKDLKKDKAQAPAIINEMIAASMGCDVAEVEEKAYQPMEPARTFTPTEPPVLFDEATPAGRAQRFLLDVTDRMGVKVDVYVDDSVENSLYIHMIGDTLGILIGRRGETLDALQYLTSLQVNKGREGYIRVTLDTENYRAKREDSLRRLAQRMANRAQKTGRRVVLEPMNPYERRVLHTALQNHPAVTTHSEGEEPNRRVVIMLANQPERAQAESGEKSERGDKPSSSRRRRSRRGRGRGAKPAAQETAPETVTEAVAVAEPSEAPGDVLGE